MLPLLPALCVYLETNLLVPVHVEQQTETVSTFVLTPGTVPASKQLLRRPPLLA